MPRQFSAFVLAIAALGITGAAVAQQAQPPSSPQWTGERFAVVIGVGRYDHPHIPSLRYAENDARAVYSFLTTKGGYKSENVLLLTDTAQQKPTLANIKRALGEWLTLKARKDDVVVVYFAGHGAPEVDAAGVDRPGFSKYLVARDTDPDSLYLTAYPMDEIATVFRRVVSERVVMLLDTCFSGSTRRRSGRLSTRTVNVTEAFLQRLQRSRGRVIITAAGPNELALELPELKGGLFTHYVLKGLDGAADADADGIVTVIELFAYVQRTVSDRARQENGRQVPVISGAVGDFPLVQTRP